MGKGVVMDVPPELQDDIEEMKEELAEEKLEEKEAAENDAKVNEDILTRAVELGGPDPNAKRPENTEEGVWRKVIGEKTFVSSDEGKTWFEEATPPTIKQHLQANWQRGRIKIFKKGMGSILACLNLVSTIVLILIGGYDPIRALIVSTFVSIGIGFGSEVIVILAGLEGEIEKEKLQKEHDKLIDKYTMLLKEYSKMEVAMQIDKVRKEKDIEYKDQNLENAEIYNTWRLKALIGEILILVDEIEKEGASVDPNIKTRLYAVANLKDDGPKRATA